MMMMIMLLNLLMVMMFCKFDDDDPFSWCLKYVLSRMFSVFLLSVFQCFSIYFKVHRKDESVLVFQSFSTFGVSVLGVSPLSTWLCLNSSDVFFIYLLHVLLHSSSGHRGLLHQCSCFFASSTLAPVHRWGFSTSAVAGLSAWRETCTPAWSITTFKFVTRSTDQFKTRRHFTLKQLGRNFRCLGLTMNLKGDRSHHITRSHLSIFCNQGR